MVGNKELAAGNSDSVRGIDPALPDLIHGPKLIGLKDIGIGGVRGAGGRIRKREWEMPNGLPGRRSPGHDVAIAIDAHSSSRPAEYRRVNDSSIGINKTRAIAGEGTTAAVPAIVRYISE